MSNAPASPAGRLQWLDAMRGFTMILVVAYHVAQISFGESEKTSSSLPFLVLFRMPLFFFVSGFLAYRSTFVWSLSNTGRQLWKKVKVQVLPALVFLCVFLIFRKPDFWQSLHDSLSVATKGGYWFTWVLLQMFVLYYAGELISRPLARGRWAFWLLCWVASVVVYETAYMPRYFSYPKSPFMQWSSMIETVRFMQFFLLGNLVRRYWGRVERLMDSRWFFPVVTLVAVVCCAEFFRWHTLHREWVNLPRTVAMYALLGLVVMFFRHYQRWFDSQRPVGRALQYVGTRTLDIYLLHFILIPKVPEVGQWLNAHQPNFVIDVALAVALALVVIAFCCLVSHLLRVSPLFSEYLFGRKPRRP